MEKILKNEIVFTILDSTHIIKCKCMDELIPIDEQIYNINYASFYCNRVKIIELYDNNENIVDSIIVFRYNYPLKKGFYIIFKENEKFKKNMYFKTFLRAYMVRNKINGIKYIINNNGEIYGFKNNVIKFNGFVDILRLNDLNYHIIFYNKSEASHYLYQDNQYYNIRYYLYNKLFCYEVYTYNNKINISRSQKGGEKNTFYEQIILCNKELKILQLLERNFGKILYEENRNVNNKIINIKKYNFNTNKLEIIHSNDNFFLIKSDENFSQDLLNFYNLNIEYDLHTLTSLKNKELCKAKKVLLKEINKLLH